MKWIRDHCKATGLRILSADKIIAHPPEPGKHQRLVRFVIDGETETGLESLGRVLFENGEQDQGPSEVAA